MKKMKLTEFIMLSLEILLLLAIVIVGIITSKGAHSSDIQLAFKLDIFGIFRGNSYKIIIAILSTIAIILFIIFWVRNLIVMKQITFGPLYLILSALMFDFANNYHIIVNEDNLFFILVLILSMLLFISSIYSLILYSRNFNKYLEKERKQNGK